jgi:hypothetical protein
MKKPRYFITLLLPLLFLAGIALPAQARGISPSAGSFQAGSLQSQPAININTNADCFALSNEATGDLISQLAGAGYGDFNFYQTLVEIRADANPSVADFIPDSFLAALQAEPASAEIFTILLNTLDIPGITVEGCSNGSLQTVPISGYFSAAEGFPTLVSDISGVGNTNFTRSTGSIPIASFDVTTGQITTTYKVFAMAWGVGAPPYSLYLPLTFR